MSFYTSLYTDIKIHTSWEVGFAQRNALQVAIVCFKYTVFTARKAQMNALQVAIVCFEYTVFTVRKTKLVRNSPLKIILLGFIAKRE